MERTFRKRKKRLKEGFQHWTLKYSIEVRHIGSTAIPGIDAKPIIDILIGVRTFKNIY